MYWAPLDHKHWKRFLLIHQIYVFLFKPCWSFKKWVYQPSMHPVLFDVFFFFPSHFVVIFCCLLKGWQDRTWATEPAGFLLLFISLIEIIIHRTCHPKWETPSVSHFCSWDTSFGCCLLLMRDGAGMGQRSKEKCSWGAFLQIRQWNCKRKHGDRCWEGDNKWIF